MQTNAPRGQKDPERRRRSVVRDHATKRLFESYLALHNWRVRHDLPDAGAHSVPVDDVVGEPLTSPFAPAPEEIPT